MSYPEAPAAPSPFDAVAERLPLARAASRAASIRGTRTVEWGGARPGLPPDIADAVAETFGVVIRHDRPAVDPLAHPAFATLFARARTEQIVLELSSRTNLVLAGTTAIVVGDGIVASTLTDALTRIGVRIVGATDDPLTALRATLAGLGTLALARLADPGIAAHYLVLCDGTIPTIPGSAIVVNASGARLPEKPNDADAPASRTGVRLAGDTRVVDIPPPVPVDANRASGLQWRIVDALVALSILVASDDADADTTLARIALAETTKGEAR